MGFFRIDLEGQSREELEAFVAKWNPIRVGWWIWGVVFFYLMGRPALPLPDLLIPVMKTRAYFIAVFVPFAIIAYVGAGIAWAVLERERKIQDCWCPAIDWHRQISLLRGKWQGPVKVILAAELLIDAFFIGNLF